MTNREVIGRFLMSIRGGPPVLVDELICGHFVVDSGKWARTRICNGCGWTRDELPKETVHFQLHPTSRISSCGERKNLNEHLSCVTCLHCLKIQVGRLIGRT